MLGHVTPSPRVRASIGPLRPQDGQLGTVPMPLTATSRLGELSPLGVTTALGIGLFAIHRVTISP